MSNRTGGGGRRGGGGGRGDFQRQPPPGGAPAYAQSQQRGRGRGGAGRGGGGGDGEAFPPFPTRREQPAPPPHHPAPKPADLPSSSSSAASASALSQDVERLTIRESEPSGSTVAPAAPPDAADPATATPPASSKSVRHPKRPGYGTIGKKCMVRANHFLVSVADADLCHYDVAITPEVTSRAINRALIRELINLYGVSHLGKKKPAYDGRKSLYTAGALPFESKDFVIKLPPKDKTSSRVDKEYRIAIRSAGRADLHHLQQFLRGQQMDAPYETIQCLDVVLREYPSANYTPVSRSFFSPKFGHRDDIGDGLECWRGYYQSLRPTQMGLSLNIDISATSFYKAVPVIDFVAEYLNLRDISRPLNDRDRVKVKKALRGLRVEGTHQKDTIRRYKITGITTLPLNQLTFELGEDGTKISVVQYFKERYNYPVRHVSWPAIQSGSDNKPIFLPMEVCKIVEGQRYSKKLNDRQVTAILRLTCKRPPEREKSIQTMVDLNNYSNDEYAKEFGIQVMNKLASVDARVLPPPRLKYHESGKEKTCNPSVGQWNMINKKMVNGGTVEHWTCLNFSRIQHEGVEQFCMDLEHMCNTIGMRFKPAPLIRPQSVHPGNIEAALRDVHRQSAEILTGKGIQGKNLQLLIIVLPDMTGSYGTIKRVCETELGIVTQCCLPKNVAKCNKQYLENVSLKINVKVGGRNTVLEDALRPNAIPFVNDKPTIIFGADVTHPPPGEDSSSSIAAVVASMDWPEVTKYRGLVSAQTHRQEMINDLYTKTQDPKKGSVHGGMIRELLIAFYRSTRQKPHRIIFYRDGVSEGQFNHVLLYEMDAIRKACASVEEGYLPPVTFVVVQKRHHTRLFPAVHGNRDSTDRSGNILPGTVVDTTICHPTEFDFYLCSHAGIQGTSRPTHYHVLYDENHFTADALQTLTNNLCYTYARCTRSVSVVPPAYYAHLAAFRARYYTEGDSEGGSMTSAGAGPRGTRERTAVVRPLPLIRDNVKDVMFFC